MVKPKHLRLVDKKVEFNVLFLARSQLVSIYTSQFHKVQFLINV